MCLFLCAVQNLDEKVDERLALVSECAHARLSQQFEDVRSLLAILHEGVQENVQLCDRIDGVLALTLADGGTGFSMGNGVMKAQESTPSPSDPS